MNDRLPDSAWLAQDGLAHVLAVLDHAGEEARVVGGAVRNALFGQPPGDVDIATTAVPDSVIERARGAGFKAVPTGIDHGTVTVIVDGTPFEVTTLRADVETYGRKAKVAFGRDWKVDAERRDFTINALSVITAKVGTTWRASNSLSISMRTRSRDSVVRPSRAAMQAARPAASGRPLPKYA